MSRMITRVLATRTKANKKNRVYCASFFMMKDFCPDEDVNGFASSLKKGNSWQKASFVRQPSTDTK